MPTLFHYTDQLGLAGILQTRVLLPSKATSQRRDVRYGDGQYLTDIAPGTMTPAQLSRALIGHPFRGSRFTHYVELDTNGLKVVCGRAGVFVIPNDQPLDLTCSVTAC